MERKLSAMAMAAAFGAMMASADTYVFDAALSGQDNVDWTVKESYSGTYSRDPAAGDTVELPAGVTAKVSAGSASWTLINTLARIVPRDGAVFEVDVPAAYEGRALLAVPVSEFGLENATDSGILRKAGDGALELTSYGNVMDDAKVKDYYVNVEVNGGDLHLYAGGTTPAELFHFQNVSVAEGATLHTCYVGYACFSGLNGEGFVTLDNTEAEQRIRLIGSGTSAYSGLMTGKIRIDVTAGRHDILCPTNTIDTICLDGTGVCGFTRFGANDSTAESSLGSGNFNFGRLTGIIYLGPGDESSSKSFWFSDDNFIDAGANGGFTLSGTFTRSNSSDMNPQFFRLGLGGSNTVNAAKISGAIIGDRKGQCHIIYLDKYGTGVWHLMNSSSRGGLGVIDVQDGTLRYDTIAEKGKMCSLGCATNLFAEKKGITYATGTPVDYAMVLGGDGTTGTLEYSGTAEAQCHSRPIAIRTNGRFVSNGSSYHLENVYALGNGSRTLTLDGEGPCVNVASGLSDGKDGGTLTVVKEGSGEWHLTGTNTFTGPLLVKGGTLRVSNYSKYRWYRICFTENLYGCSRYTVVSASPPTESAMGYIQMLEMGLYDSEGYCLIAGFRTDEVNGKPSAGGIERHSFDGIYCGMTNSVVALGTKNAQDFISNGQLFQLFDNKKNTKMAVKVVNSSVGIVQSDPSTWMPIVVRLPDDAGEAVRIDFMGSISRTGEYNGRCLTAYRLDASIDGVRWDIGIAQNTALEVPEAGGRWYSDPDNTSVSTGRRQNKGYVIDSPTPSVLNHHAFTKVGVANGGVLEVLGEPLTISGLEIDASASAGAMSNIVFAAEGTVNVVNADVSGGAALELPGDYSELDGFANLSGWHVSLDGDGCVSKSIGIRDGKLLLLPKGFRFILR